MIRGDLRIPEGPPPRTAVVVVHGFKGFKDWGFFPHLCEQIAAAGHAAVSFNFSWNGIGADDPQELTELELFGRNTYTRELGELLWMLEEVATSDLMPLKPRKIGLVGHSRGGAQAILAATESDRVDALVTWSAVGNLDRWTEDTLEEWRGEGRVYVLNSRTGQQMPLDVTLLEDFEANRERLDVRRAAGTVQVPWLILHGTEDLTVDWKDSESLAGAASGAKHILVEGAGHTYEVGHPFQGPSLQLREALEATLRHLETNL
jgi:dienelactone hydrolase